MRPEPIRYQHCKWYVKLWRWRWKLLVPFWTLWLYLSQWPCIWDERLNVEPHLRLIDPVGFRTTWHLVHGLVEYRMHWYYEWDEVSRRLKDYLAESPEED